MDFYCTPRQGCIV